MKKIARAFICGGLFTLLFFYSQSLFAQKINKRELRRIDVISFLPDTSDGNADTFWKAILEEENEVSATINKIMTQKRGLGAAARKELNSAILRHLQYYGSIIEFDSSLDSLKFHLIGNLANQIYIHKLNELSLNAFAAPNGNIVIYSGLKDALSGFRQEYIIAIIAHEIVHILLKHSLIQSYKQKKRERNNKIGAGIAVGLQAFADGMNAIKSGRYTDNSAYYASIFNSAKNDTYMYQFRYSREIELQADVVAFRLLDWIGIGGEKLKEALILIQAPFEYHSDTDNHYTITKRVEILKNLENQHRIKYLESPLKANNNRIRETSLKFIEIKIGEEIILKTLSGKPSVWSSQDTTVVRVNKNGLIKGLLNGQALVWANDTISNTPELHVINVVGNR